MNILQAKAIFEQRAEQHGFKVAGLTSSNLTLGWVSRALAKAAELRLTWRGSDELLTLEVSQGPSPGPVSGWIVLFSQRCPSGDIPARDEDESWESAVLYGFELMGPSGYPTAT